MKLEYSKKGKLNYIDFEFKHLKLFLHKNESNYKDSGGY